ncbi:Rad52/Rad22 family DNA repair protein [Yersinia intermedia]|uniref:Rad52/Rad22 family DNA repair protein n=1 Tax=Yersinia intermedia TaxID=631 RepID=UPI0005ACF2FD|nr:Rad52/Rad22 family DNA repair protein [Yersinia intermedia]AJJ18158.1 rad52/22 double-strand break repair family protein [Yersinia intermedia]
MDLNKLDEPFPAADIEWRVQSCGITKDSKPWAMVLAYVTNRAIMKRLDDVCGKAFWRNEFQPAPDSGVMCGISIKVEEEWITKWDAAENTQVEAVKGGMSGAMKRAAVQWGIGRYLYQLEEGFAEISIEKKSGWNRAKTKEQKIIYWRPPALPDWALPPKQEPQQQPQQQNNAHTLQQRTPDQYLADFTGWAISCTDQIALKDAYDGLCKRLTQHPELADKANKAYQDQLSDLNKAA